MKIPEGEVVPFRAGGYVQLEAPPHTVHYKDFDIAKEYHEDWDNFNLWRYTSTVDEPVIRAYSMANYPEEKVLLNLISVSQVRRQELLKVFHQVRCHLMYSA